MGLTELIAPLYNSKELQQFSLEEKAVKILQKFIDSQGKYISLSAAKHNYKNISAQDVFIIAAELERLGYVLGKLDKGRLVYKFNDTSQRTEVSIPIDNIKAAQKRFEERLSKKIERAAKTIEKYKNLGSLVEVVETKDAKNEHDIELERQLMKGTTPQKEYVPTFVSVKTALELHEAKECNPANCRFCLMAKETEIGLGL